jgi:hypothetical protein
MSALAQNDMPVRRWLGRRALLQIMIRSFAMLRRAFKKTAAGAACHRPHSRRVVVLAEAVSAPVMPDVLIIAEAREPWPSFALNLLLFWF